MNGFYAYRGTGTDVLTGGLTHAEIVNQSTRPQRGPAHEHAWIRDVPRTCICDHRYDHREHRYVPVWTRDGCPWHGGKVK